MNLILRGLILFLFSTVSLMGQSADELINNYYDDAFNPFAKGKWQVGLTFSVEDKKLGNTFNILGFERILEGDEFNWSVNSRAGYFIGNNIQVGLGFNYARERSDAIGIDPGLETTDTVSRSSLNNSFAFVPSLRTYFPLTPNKRLSFFNDIKMSIGTSNGDLETIENGTTTDKTETKEFTFGIGLSPGITFFAIESVAFEISLDVLGYQYQNITESDSDGNETQFRTHNVDFTLNLLSLNFGLAYYFGAKR